jgi:hypothetical protein
VSALLPDPLSGHHHRKLSGCVSAGQQQQQPTPLAFLLLLAFMLFLVSLLLPASLLLLVSLL